MKKLGIALISLLALGAAQAQEQNYPGWAYAIPTAENEVAAPKDEGQLFSLPGSEGRFTRNQISGFGMKPPADWYPGDHPTMPALVSTGDPKRAITACAACHYPNGKGRPQNAGLAGLNAEYLARQMRDMKDGLRTSSEPRKRNAQQMIFYAKAMTEAEIAETAAYYAALPPTVPIKVVETTAAIPRMRSQDGMWLPDESASREGLGARIIETPADVEREQLRDPRANFIAYVPAGAVAKGQALAARCTMCHGERLEGRGIIPGIAGRSPSYLGRQLYDFQTGARKSPMAAMMKPAAMKLSGEDMINITAYLATLPAKP
jgi:cytochrome c553